jgi:glycosyltransferase involved in cell wall biosynthesis
MDKKISVLLSVFNEEKNIAASIESICNQTYENFEFLIIDDCSTDNSYEIINEFSNRDDRIKIIRNSSNIGLTKSLNKLIKTSSGDYIARQDADDISLLNRFERQIELLNNLDYQACTTRAIIREETRITPNRSFYIPKFLIMNLKNPFVHGSLMIRKKAIESIGLYDEDFYYAQDYKLMSDLISSGYKIKIIKEPLYILNVKDNISTNFYEKQKYYADCVKKKIKPEIFAT